MTEPAAGGVRPLVLVRGAGDMASGTAWRLARAGFPVALTELPEPLVVRRGVSFAEAVHQGEAVVEGQRARRAKDAEEARQLLSQGILPVLVDPQGRCRQELQPAVLVDAILAKRNLGTSLSHAPLVVALGPGFTAGLDCHAVVETQRGHWLGRVHWRGSAAADTGLPEEVMGRGPERVLRAPADGRLEPVRQIGQRVEEGDLLARVAGVEIRAPFAGVLRGLVREGTRVRAGMKVGDVDPRSDPRCCWTISDKSLAVAGGVLEAILAWQAGRAPPPSGLGGQSGEGGRASPGGSPGGELWRALGVERGEIVALVGGGGKTAALRLMREELLAQGWKVVVTTTTRLGREEAGELGEVVLRGLEGDKALGIEPGEVAALRGSADLVLVEADGSRQRSLKAPADHEPAIPAEADRVILLVGADALGQPLEGDWVHRPERVAALTGLRPGEPLSPRAVAWCLTHPLGGLKGVPEEAEVAVVINKVEGPEAEGRARELAAELISHSRLQRVVLASLHSAQPVRELLLNPAARPAEDG